MDASSSSSAKNFNIDDSELECRVCRSGPDPPLRPLYAPCNCSGSIALVHQDCLETWLTHAHKTKCELCGFKYQFSPQYAENTPSVLPIRVLFTTMFKKLINDYLPFAFRMVAAIVVWLGFVPLLTCQLYRMWMRLESFNLSSFPQRIPRDTVTGFVLAAFVVFTFIVMMSFLDFIRVHRLPEEAARRQRNDIDLRQQQQQQQQQAQQQAQNQHPQPQVQPQQPVQPPPQQQPVQAAAPRREEIVRPLNGDQAGPALPEEPQAFDEGLPELLDGEGGDADLQGGVDNDFDAFENDLPPGEGEIQFALDELLGLRGITHLLRNAWLLLAFNCVYIGLFASFPYMVGVSICRFFGQSAWVKTMYSMLNWLVPQSIIFTSQVNTLSSASEDALQFSDMVLVVLGYASLFLMIFALSESLYTLRELFNPSFLTNSIISLAAFANIVKVALLLFIRVFILPVILGIVVLVFANKFLGYGTNEWAIFVASNVVGSVSLSWVAGISYMVSTTLTVLQLREILHPDILARSIRPQEPHYQLLLSLMYESTFTHCRRVVTSMMVYLSLLVLCVYAPLYIARHTLGMHVTIASAVSVAEQSVISDAATAGATSTIFPLYFNYFIPQIQIPFELAFAHLTFLTLLDRHKDKIGHALFFWLKTVGGALGLNRTLLPFAMIPYQAAQVDYPDTNHRMFHKDGRVYSANLDGPLVRGPMVRPPPRWDEQNGRNTARWAWGTEAKTHTELHVAPRTTPILWVPRLLLLAFVSWVVIGLMVIVGMFFPLGLGRTLLKLMQIPSWLMHDPFCYSLGAACTWVLFSLASTVNLGVLTPYIQACRKLSKSNMRLIVRVVLHWLIAELGVGMTIRACLIVTPLSQHWNWPSVSLILGTYLKGTFFASGFVGLIYYGYLERLLSFLDYKAPDVVTDDQGISVTRLVENRDPTIQALSDWATTLRETLQKPTLIYRGPNIWEVDIARVEQLRTLLVKPLYFKFFRRTVLYYLQLHAARFTVMFMGKSNVKIPYDIVLGVFDASEIDSWLASTLRLLILQSCIVLPMLPLAGALCRVWWKRINATVLDENYLVGRTLVNSTTRSQSNMTNSNMGSS